MQDSHKKFVRLLVVLLALIFLGLAVLSIRQHQLSAVIEVNAVPKESQITIDGHSAKQGVNHVAPGLHVVTIEHFGFTEYTQRLTSVAHKTQSVQSVLVSNSSATANWYLNHPEDAKLAEGLSDHAVDRHVKKLVKDSPLITLLPFVAGGLQYRVDYGTVSGGKTTIIVTAPDITGQQAGLAWIKSIGYDPSAYNVQYVTATVEPLAP